jgi:formamidopyrimidine-DNA glycosylase
MPELPEVESIRLELEKSCVGKTIRAVSFALPRLLDKNSINLQLLEGQKIQNTGRRGKYMWLETTGYCLLVHLGMSGVLLVNSEKQKHTHLVLEFESGGHLHYKDPRTFGYLNLQKSRSDFSRVMNLGPDAISRDFNKTYFHKKLKRTQREIKICLLDQHLVAGIGNIYASEILFRSGVSPFRRGEEITGEECGLLCKNTKIILKKSIANRGTTFADYRLTNGKKGAFRDFLKVFQKEGLECPVCKSTILKTEQHKRSTFYCEQCQK